MASKRKKAAPPSEPAPLPPDADAFTVKEFCARHRISESMYYKMRKAGNGPLEMRVGSMILISKEAAANWRAARERNSTAA